LLAILALKHVTPDFDLGLFRFVLGTRFGNWSTVLVVPKVVPPFVASFLTVNEHHLRSAVAATEV